MGGWRSEEARGPRAGVGWPARGEGAGELGGAGGEWEGRRAWRGRRGVSMRRDVCAHASGASVSIGTRRL